MAVDEYTGLGGRGLCGNLHGGLHGLNLVFQVSGGAELLKLLYLLRGQFFTVDKDACLGKYAARAGLGMDDG